jgi:ssDNA-binding Zn-finger/Zn-ribbon topoisomerase 1
MSRVPICRFRSYKKVIKQKRCTLTESILCDILLCYLPEIANCGNETQTNMERVYATLCKKRKVQNIIIQCVQKAWKHPNENVTHNF